MLSGWFCLQARVYSAALPFHPMDSTSGFHPLDSTLWTPPYGFPPLTLPAAGHGGRWRLHSGARRVPEEGCRHAGQPHIHRALHHQVSGDSWKGVAFHCWRESPEGCSGAETCSPSWYANPAHLLVVTLLPVGARAAAILLSAPSHIPCPFSQSSPHCSTYLIFLPAAGWSTCTPAACGSCSPFTLSRRHPAAATSASSLQPTGCRCWCRRCSSMYMCIWRSSVGAALTGEGTGSGLRPAQPAAAGPDESSCPVSACYYMHNSPTAPNTLVGAGSCRHGCCTWALMMHQTRTAWCSTASSRCCRAGASWRPPSTTSQPPRTCECRAQSVASLAGVFASRLTGERLRALISAPPNQNLTAVKAYSAACYGVLVQGRGGVPGLAAGVRRGTGAVRGFCQRWRPPERGLPWPPAGQWRSSHAQAEQAAAAEPRGGAQRELRRVPKGEWCPAGLLGRAGINGMQRTRTGVLAASPALTWQSSVLNPRPHAHVSAGPGEGAHRGSRSRSSGWRPCTGCCGRATQGVRVEHCAACRHHGGPGGGGAGVAGVQDRWVVFTWLRGCLRVPEMDAWCIWVVRAQA